LNLIGGTGGLYVGKEAAVYAVAWSCKCDNGGWHNPFSCTSL